MKTLVVSNPKAGRRTSRAHRKLISELRDEGLEFDIAVTKSPEDGSAMARRAAAEGYDVVVAAGGDGTVNEVVNGLAGTDTALGILPLGTVNVFARQLKIPLSLPQAARVISEGWTRQVDLGRAGDRHFTLMAGLGFDAAVVANVVQPLKDLIGPSAYVLKGIEALAKYTPTEVTLQMPEEAYHGTVFLVVVANVSMYAYELQVAPYAAPDDGLLDVIVFERPVTDRIGFVRQIVQTLFRRHLRHPAVRYYQTPRVRVLSTPDIMIQLDGDAFGSTPVDITVAPRGLRVVAPAG